MTKHNVVVIGAATGGREAALAKRLAASSHVDTVYCVPGNAGTAAYATNIELDLVDGFRNLLIFCKYHDIKLVVVGPEALLAQGIVNYLELNHIPVFGPSKEATQIESSKAYAKRFMKSLKIPTAEYNVFGPADLKAAIKYVHSQSYPLFIKASGLAGGKGAVPCHTASEAEVTLEAMMRGGKFGQAGETVVIEDFLDGPELSLHALSDGTTYTALPFVQDCKQVGPNVFGLNQTLNTGGMGAAGPKFLSTKLNVTKAELLSIVGITFEGLRNRGIPFKGCLYPGFKLTKDGPKMLEYNARFGDPETQVFMRLLKSDLFELLYACATGTLSEITVAWKFDTYAACINLTSGGYPEKFETGFPIEGLNQASHIPGVEIFHAGTALRDGKVVTSGGRVLSITAVGESIWEAMDTANRAASIISFKNMHYRRDIGTSELIGA